MNPVPRQLRTRIEAFLAEVPAVGVLGPRQVGKSTLARELARTREAVVLDLQLPESRAQLTEPTLFFRSHARSLVVVDEIQREPKLFSALRPLIDEDRRAGRLLILGSASPQLMRGANESLAGRILYVELTPLTLAEAQECGIAWTDHLVVGGFPEPLLHLSPRVRRAWAADYIATFVTRDLAELGVNVNEAELERLAAMLAHVHGGPLNASSLAKGLRISARTVQRYVELLERAFLIRTLRPWFRNFGKRLVKAPRVYWRDSGLRHSQLGIRDYGALLLHPSLGSSWEGYVIEELCRAAGREATPYYFRTQDGAELDLLLEFGAGRLLAFECKFSTGPTLSKGTHNAIGYVHPAHTYVVTPETSTFPIGEGVTVLSLPAAIAVVRAEAMVGDEA